MAMLDLLEPFRRFRIFVMAVERVTTRRQAVARRGRAIAEGAANALAFLRRALQDVPGQFRISKHHAAQPDAVGPAFTYNRLYDVW